MSDLDDAIRRAILGDRPMPGSPGYGLDPRPLLRGDWHPERVVDIAAAFRRTVRCTRECNGCGFTICATALDVPECRTIASLMLDSEAARHECSVVLRRRCVESVGADGQVWLTPIEPEWGSKP